MKRKLEKKLKRVRQVSPSKDDVTDSSEDMSEPDCCDLGLCFDWLLVV